MSTRLNGTSLFTGINSGLTSTYSILAQANPDGVTLDGIASARSNTALTSSLNQNFASYMQTNFSTFDKDGDGKIGASELSDLTNKMSTQGMTQAQLAQLGTAAGLSSNTLEQVLNHFNDIDTNKDGKVTNAEIAAFSINSDKEKKMAEYTNKAATNMSMFYGDENASSTKSASLLDYKYLSDNQQ